CGETEEISFEISPEITDAYFNISLLGGITLEEEELEVVEEIIDSLTTYLYSTAVQPYQVQALWVTQAIGILMAIGMICYVIADVLKAGTGVFKEGLKK
ncbi:unnamed protein product, partial [marine sediment metagenome]